METIKWGAFFLLGLGLRSNGCNTCFYCSGSIVEIDSGFHLSSPSVWPAPSIPLLARATDRCGDDNYLPKVFTVVVRKNLGNGQGVPTAEKLICECSAGEHNAANGVAPLFSS